MPNRRRALRRRVAAVATLILVASCSASRGDGPSASDVLDRVAEVARAGGTEQQIADALRGEFANDKPRFADNDEGWTPFPPIVRSGVSSIDSRVTEDQVRVAVVYAEAEPSHGNMYCLYADLPPQGPVRWATAEADFGRSDHCPMDAVGADTRWTEGP